MVLIKVLKRKDASSVLVAIILAMIISQPLTTTTMRISSKISDLGNNGPYGGGGDWKTQYLFPIVWALVQIVVLEILGWIAVFGAMPFKRKRG